MRHSARLWISSNTSARRCGAEKVRRELSTIAGQALADALTETERRIAALITQGRTNREIAAALFVTQNTVQTHLRHIFQKLGVRSRTELAARLLSAPASATAVAGPEPRWSLTLASSASTKCRRRSPRNGDGQRPNPGHIRLFQR